jgi:uncharacterized HAD superfamily protein
VNKTLFCMDIDGTIAHAGRRFAEAGEEPNRDQKDVYEAWLSRIQSHETMLQDAPVVGMQSLLWSLYNSPNELIYLTAREEKYRYTTCQWLNNHSFPNGSLYMRGEGDHRDGVELKEALIKMTKNLYHCDAVVVVDDDGKGDIEAMCARNGYTFLKARSGGQK